MASTTPSPFTQDEVDLLISRDHEELGREEYWYTLTDTGLIRFADSSAPIPPDAPFPERYRTEEGADRLRMIDTQGATLSDSSSPWDIPLSPHDLWETVNELTHIGYLA